MIRSYLFISEKQTFKKKSNVYFWQRDNLARALEKNNNTDADLYNKLELVFPRRIQRYDTVL